MSATQARPFPRPCQYQACGQQLYGAVRFCPFCAGKQDVPEPAAPPIELQIERQSEIAAATTPDLAKNTSPAPDKLPRTAAPKPQAEPLSKGSSPATRAGPARNEDDKSIFPSPAVWGLALLVILLGAFAYRMTFQGGKSAAQERKELITPEHRLKLLEDGYDCLQHKDYACAVAKAEILLDSEPRNAQAKKLLKEAKNARDSQPKENSSAEIEFKVLLENLVAAAKECVAQHDAPCVRRNIEDLANKAPSDPRLANLNYLAAKDCGELRDTSCMRLNIDELRERVPNDKHLPDLDKWLVKLEYEKARGPLDNPPAGDNAATSPSAKDSTEKPASKLMALAQQQLAHGDYETAISTANAAKVLEPDNQLIDVFIEQAKQTRDARLK